MSHFQSYNANPQHNRVGDCVIRAVSKVLNQEWERTYLELCIQGFLMADMPSSNAVWGAYLKAKGFERELIPTECADCYTVERFCKEHPEGTYLLAISGHVVAVQDGKFFDTWNSADEVPVYYWQKK